MTGVMEAFTFILYRLNEIGQIAIYISRSQRWPVDIIFNKGVHRC